MAETPADGGAQDVAVEVAPAEIPGGRRNHARELMGVRGGFGFATGCGLRFAGTGLGCWCCCRWE